LTNVLWLYWESSPSGEPDYIRLCRKSMKVHATSYEVVLVTPDNLKQFLPDIPDRVFDIERGTMDDPRQRRIDAIPQRADFIRAFLLEKYGGIYVDSDAISLGDLGGYFSLLRQYDFLAVRRSSFGKTHISVGFMGARRGGTVVSEYVTQLKDRLQGDLSYEWNEIGQSLLTPIFDRHRDIVFEVPEKEIQPVTWENARSLFVSTSHKLDEIITPRTRVFMLYHGPFERELRNVGMNELYFSPMLVSQAFRHALPEWAFNEVQKGYVSH
jgi:hypothetical protein